MKKLNLKFILMAILFVMAISFNACKEQGAKTENSEQSIETQTVYECPMHDEIKGVKGDTCTICGMDLEPIDNK